MSKQKSATEVKSIKLYQPHDKQKELIQACIYDDAFFIVCAAGRRAGKSIFLMGQAIYWSLIEVKQIIYYICPTDSQCENVIDEIQKALNNSGVVKKINNSKGNRIIEFTNGSRIEFKSAMAADSLRGGKCHFMILDECSYMNRTVVENILLPMLAVGGKKVLAASTPKGKNFFYEWFIKGMKGGDKKFKSFRFTSLDNPLVDSTIVELMRNQMPELAFSQEYEANFVDGGSVFRNIEEACCLSIGEWNKKLQTVAGIDIGLVNDECVITVLTSDGNMVDQVCFTGVEAPELREKVLDTLKKYKVSKCLIEDNGMGLPICQDLKRMYPNIEAFTTTNKSKDEIISKLVAAFSGKEIKLIKNDELILQLESFIFELTNMGRIRYCAAPGFHDDRVMSLAIAFSLTWNFRKFGAQPKKYVTGQDVTGNHLIDRKVRPDIRPPMNTRIKF